MMRKKIYDAAGSTLGFWYEVGPTSTTSLSRSLLKTQAEIVSGRQSGERLAQHWTGVFDTRTGETYAVSRLDVFVSGDRHLSIAFDAGFRNIEADWVRAYRRGIEYEGNRFANFLEAGDGDDRLYGGAGSDTLEGYKGDDLLDGGAGADVMRGGEGDDIYIVGHRRDIVFEEAHGGTDTVRASVSFSLPFGVENLRLTGGGDLRGTGNELANSIRGNGGANALHGEEGNDRILGGGGADRIFGGDGDDVLFGGKGRDRIDGGAGADRLFGGAGSDTLAGGDGNDRLDGGRGRDEMLGGPGDDVYVVDDPRDRIFEQREGGFDTVLARAGYRLPDNVEALTLTGDKPLVGRGNALGNTIAGNGADNRLFGYDGNDVLRGGGGADRLVGGAGDDTLYGGRGADTLVGGDGYDGLFGGAGRDVFAFVLVREARAYHFSNYIGDFASGSDRIDLRGIDADATTPGRQGFVFLGAGDFTGSAGQVRFADGRLSGDIDGDRSGDFDVEIRGFVAIGAADLLL